MGRIKWKTLLNVDGPAGKPLKLFASLDVARVGCIEAPINPTGNLVPCPAQPYLLPVPSVVVVDLIFSTPGQTFAGWVGGRAGLGTLTGLPERAREGCLSKILMRF